MKTPKGIELQIMNLKGKDYLPVAQRVLWFRELHPDWSIVTYLISETPVNATFKAEIRNDKGIVIATSHKSETKQGFADFIEKAETGAIGRALALCGFGTQFCGDELDEKGRLADSPQESRVQPRAAQPTRAPSQNGASKPPITPKQMGMLKGLFRDLGLTNDEIKAAIKSYEAPELEMLSQWAASQLIGKYMDLRSRKAQEMPDFGEPDSVPF